MRSANINLFLFASYCLTTLPQGLVLFTKADPVLCPAVPNVLLKENID